LGRPACSILFLQNILSMPLVLFADVKYLWHNWFA